MAWRLHEHVLRGEIDNRTRGRVVGRIWLAGIAEPLVLDLLGDCYPDLAGCLLDFENPQPVAMTTKAPAARQRGTAGDITASRKVRVFDIPFEDAYAMIKAGGTPPEHMANALYLEWHSDLSGRFVIESSGVLVSKSPSRLGVSARRNSAERLRSAADEASNAFAIEIRADGTEQEWDEFRCEELLRECDTRGEKYRLLLEKYVVIPIVIGSLRTRWAGRGWRKRSMRRGKRLWSTKTATNSRGVPTSLPQKSNFPHRILHVKGSIGCG